MLAAPPLQKPDRAPKALLSPVVRLALPQGEAPRRSHQVPPGSSRSPGVVSVLSVGASAPWIVAKAAPSSALRPVKASSSTSAAQDSPAESASAATQDAATARSPRSAASARALSRAAAVATASAAHTPYRRARSATRQKRGGTPGGRGRAAPRGRVRDPPVEVPSSGVVIAADPGDPRPASASRPAMGTPRSSPAPVANPPRPPPAMKDSTGAVGVASPKAVNLAAPTGAAPAAVGQVGFPSPFPGPDPSPASPSTALGGDEGATAPPVAPAASATCLSPDRSVRSGEGGWESRVEM